MRINAVFEGGGVKAIGLAGAVCASEEKGVVFERVAGTSSGSIIAAFLAAGYRGRQIEQMISNTPFASFLAHNGLHRIRVIGPMLRMFIKKGLYSGERLEYWLSQTLLQRGIQTFADLPPGKLRIIASDISQGKMLVLPDDIVQYGLEPGKLAVARAVRMSCSIPYFFDPVILRKPVQAGVNPVQAFKRQSIYIVDGGLLSNFPLWLFDRKEAKSNVVPTIGYQLVGRNEHKPRTIYGPFTMFQALIATMLEAHDERYIEDYNRFRTIKVPTLGVGSTQFDLAPHKSRELFASGYQAAKQFFEEWSPADYQEQYQKKVLR